MRDEQKEFILANWDTMTKQELADALDITYYQVEWFLKQQKRTKYVQNKWTPEEEALVLAMFPDKNITPEEICAAIPRHRWTGISKRAQELGCASRNKPGKVWKSEHLGYMYNHNGAIHRQVYEQTHNVKLTSNDIVHHIDGNKLNNDPSNLEVMTRAEHAAHHGRLHNNLEVKMR